MDCLMIQRSRVKFLFGFALLVVGVLGIKAAQQGWFTVHPPLELNDQPVLLFFSLSDGCDCQMKVVRKAATQIAFWYPPEHLRINTIWINFDQRPDVADYYHVVRTPALVLLNSNGEVFWMRDEPHSYDKPFVMAEVEEQITALLAMEGK
jgi:hypothetical protein